MLKRLMNWLLGKDAPAPTTPTGHATPSTAHRAATMIAEAKPTVRTATHAAAPSVMAVAGPATHDRPHAPVRKPEQHEIALRAHQIWLERGGEATANWLQAEHELAERFARR